MDMITAAQVAQNLQQRANDGSFKNENACVIRDFHSIINETAGMLVSLNRSNVLADRELLLELAYNYAMLWQERYEGTYPENMEAIEAWLDSWKHSMLESGSI